MLLATKARIVFEKHFGYSPSHEFHAPGRVNLIGEHTDYNDGFVLPAAINYGTTIVASLRDDTTVRACAMNMDEDIAEFDLSKPLTSSTTQGWSNYLRGMCKYLLDANFQLTGMDLVIVGDVPYGAGLSSSAALEMVIARAFTTIIDQPIDPKAAALIGQKNENQFIGANTGIMDQLISALGTENHALLIDCQSLSTEAIPLDPAFAIVIFNSNVQRGLVDSEYNTRRKQCQEAAKILGVETLRQTTLVQLEHTKTQMSETLYRRARHVISENERTLQAAEALRQKNWSQLASLMVASHESMKTDFEITVPAIDGLVDMINTHLPEGTGAARMTGGGFGGCVVALIEQPHVDSTINLVQHRYEAKFGIKENVYVCHAVNGAFQN